MWNKRYIKILLPYTIVLIAIYSVLPYPNSIGKLLKSFNITALWWVIIFLMLLLYWTAKKYFFDITERKTLLFVHYYLLWNIFEILRGLFIAETYWDWKGLITNSMALFIPIVAYIATNKIFLQSIIRCYVLYALPLFFIFAFLILPGAFGFYLVPITFIMLLFPTLTIRWKMFLFTLTCIVILAELGARSNVIKFGIPVLLLLVYFLRNIITIPLLEVVRKVLFLLPIILFVFAISGVFNVFKIQEYITGEYVEIKRNDFGQVVENNLTADTRTFLYIEVLQTAVKYNSWIIGRSPARGNETEAFSSLKEITGREERLTNEVAILNIFTWTGIIGVMFYFFIFYRASYLAVNYSNNIYCKMLGLFIAFRWLYGWVEDINNFSLTTFFLWFMLGVCFSKSFRSMNNKEMKYWARGIFDKRYRSYFLPTT